MDILEVIALLTLFVACIRLGMDIKNKQKKITALRQKYAVIFFNLNSQG